MSLTITTAHLIYLSAGLIAGGILMHIIGRKSTGDGLLSKLFTSNREFDTTLGMILTSVLIFFKIHHFQDDLKAEAGYIILAAVNGLMGILGYKKGVSDAQNGNGNGKTP